jgi:glycosyltransferase involved in cell wall biosynthesis
MKARPGILVIGPTPPPHHGVSMAVRALLDSDLARHYDLSHVDLADRRGIEHVDQPDLHDVLLFVKQWWLVMARLVFRRPRIVYLAISQRLIGFLRDSLFILPSRLFGARVVLHLHGSDFRRWCDAQPYLSRTLAGFVLRRVDRVVVLGESLRPLFDGLLPPDRISVVPNGIAWGPAPNNSDTASAGPQPFRVLYFGTLTSLKGVFVLLDAIPAVLRVRRDVEFVLAGPWFRPEEQIKALELIRRFNLERVVIFPGAVTCTQGKRRVFESAHLFVFPGVQQEGQPLVVLEAMAAGLPVIFTDRGCLRETVIEGHNGWEVPLHDPDALACRILWFMTHEDHRIRMARASRLRYEQCYTRERFASNMMRVLGEVEKGDRPCAALLASTPGKLD